MCSWLQTVAVHNHVLIVASVWHGVFGLLVGVATLKRMLISSNKFKITLLFISQSASRKVQEYMTENKVYGHLNSHSAI